MIDFSKIDFYVRSCKVSPYNNSFSPLVYLDFDLKIREVSKSLRFRTLVDVNSAVYKCLSFSNSSPLVVSRKYLLFLYEYLRSNYSSELSDLFNKHLEKNRISLFSKMSGVERNYIKALELFDSLPTYDYRAHKYLSIEYYRIMDNLQLCKYLSEKDIMDLCHDALYGGLDTSMYHARKYYK